MLLTALPTYAYAWNRHLMAKAHTLKSRASLAGGWLVFALSAAATATVLQLVWRLPTLATLLPLAVAVGAGGYLYLHHRAQRLLQTGDLPELLEAWQRAYAERGQPKELEPLFRATTLAAYGLTSRARQVLLLAPKGNVWQRALEQRLLADTLINAIDGDRQRALAAAVAISQLPLPASRTARARTMTRRAGTQALARAFARQTRAGDIRALRAAQKENPLLALPFRYAEVAATILRGKRATARELLERLPQLPPESAFAELAADLRSELEMPASAAADS